MEAADRLSFPELERLRRDRLRELIAYCYTHVPYVRARMRDVGVDPSQIREPSDLRLLPIMTKADVRKHRPEMHSDIAGKLKRLTTGGSTGEPLIFDIAKRRTA